VVSKRKKKMRVMMTMRWTTMPVMTMMMGMRTMIMVVMRPSSDRINSDSSDVVEKQGGRRNATKISNFSD